MKNFKRNENRIIFFQRKEILRNGESKDLKIFQVSIEVKRTEEVVVEGFAAKNMNTCMVTRGRLWLGMCCFVDPARISGYGFLIRYG